MVAFAGCACACAGAAMSFIEREVERASGSLSCLLVGEKTFTILLSRYSLSMETKRTRN